MEGVDLNFLSENEVEAIVSVVEKDFELKAAEKARLCRRRKDLINCDHRAYSHQIHLLQHSNYPTSSESSGNLCDICANFFFPLISPKRICFSCRITVCRACCVYLPRFQSYICSICQKQKDLVAMNCTWFYDNVRKKYMEGGSQIVANSLSEYPRKNVISSSILSMVKGAQITKFKHQIQETSNIILESFMKIESLHRSNEEIKSKKYSELINRFIESLNQIIRSTAQVLYITLENYNKKLERFTKNIDIEVLVTLHEEVEMIVGKKINVKRCQRIVERGMKKLEDLEAPYNLETSLSSAIVEKLCSDHQQYVMAEFKISYEDLNPILKLMVPKNRMDSIDFDYDSVSQAPSRHGTVRRGAHNRPIGNSMLLEYPDVPDDEFNDCSDSQHSSTMYRFSGPAEKSARVSKQWSQRQRHEQQHHQPHVASPTSRIPRVRSSIRSSDKVVQIETAEPDIVDVDVVSISGQSTKSNPPDNWMLSARYPRGSLMGLVAADDEVDNISKDQDRDSTTRSDSPVVYTATEFVAMTPSRVWQSQEELHKHLDEDIDELVINNDIKLTENKPLSKNNIEREYRRNFIETVKPTETTKTTRSTQSHDSGIAVSSTHDYETQPPIVPNRRASSTRIPVSPPSKNGIKTVPIATKVSDNRAKVIQTKHRTQIPLTKSLQQSNHKNTEVNETDYDLPEPNDSDIDEMPVINRRISACKRKKV